MTTQTDLRGHKEGAYRVALETEPRVSYLASSPHAVAWDSFGDRLLYTRQLWHYRVRKGTEEVVDWGHLDTEIAQIPRGAMPLNSLGQGSQLALVVRDELTGDPGWAGDVLPEVLAVDRESGQFVVFWHRLSVADPNTTFAKSFSSGGGMMSEAAFLQPNDGTPPWEVPHAIAHDGTVFSIERSDDHAAEVGDPAAGHVARRSLGSLGTRNAVWNPGDPWVFPHSLALRPDGDVLYVLVTKLNNPGGFGTFQRSFLVLLDAGDLSFMSQHELGFSLPPGGDRPYYMGAWQSAGSANSGGMFICLEDGSFVSSCETPDGWSSQPWDPIVRGVFRWSGDGPGVFLESKGALLPTPIHAVPAEPPATGTAAVIGAWSGSFPEDRDL